MAKKESDFQKHVKDRLYSEFPGCVVTKLDPNDTQGIPDLLVLNEDKWACLEVKKSIDAPHRPNQDYYVHKMRRMSYSSFLYPENEEEVFNELQQALKPSRRSRISKRKPKRMA